MDLISNMLSTLHLNANIFMHSTFCNEWVIDVGDFNVATFHLISHGNCWLHLPHQKPVALYERDLLILPHNAPHLVTNSPEPARAETLRNTPADIVCGPSVTLICGNVTFSQNYWNPLVEALPEYVIMPTQDSRDTTLGKVIEALIRESESNDSGSEAIIDRLADILFIEVLRAYIKKDHGNSFLAAISDPKISRALVEFHAEPGKNWDVQSLADIACLSRSAFAERFLNLVGASPMNYVTRWRMQYAHNKLTETMESIGEIANSCSYLSEESFSKAFRKEFGLSPNAVRRRETANERGSMISVSGDISDSSKILYSPLEANQLRYNSAVVFVDVRDTEDYTNAHISGAVSIPELFYSLSMTTPEGLQEMQDTLQPLLRKAGIDRDKTVIVYEDNLGSRYGSSCRSYFQLKCFGHPNIGVLDGGLDRWIREGYPVDSKQVKNAPSKFDIVFKRDSLATLDDILLSLDHPDIKLLDNRDKEEWLGMSSAPADYPADFLPRVGRIPGARWIDWNNFMDSTDNIKHFKSAEQVHAICAQAGLYPDDDIIIYCFKGSRAANTYIALKLAGFKHVRNYYGSWNEWSRNASLPVMAVKLIS